MRILTTHKAVPSSPLTLAAIDQPGHGGANHEYQITGYDDGLPCDIQFQNGPVPQHGINGLTNEVLLAIVQDRLRCFQCGPFPSESNAQALRHVNEALDHLHARTRERMARGVEGKHAL